LFSLMSKFVGDGGKFNKAGASNIISIHTQSSVALPVSTQWLVSEGAIR
jgi:hypothetical protein